MSATYTQTLRDMRRSALRRRTRCQARFASTADELACYMIMNINKGYSGIVTTRRQPREERALSTSTSPWKSP
jgi:hypothetical protein